MSCAQRTLPQRVRADRSFELADELLVAPERELRVDAVLDRGDAQLLETGRLGRAKSSYANSTNAGPRQRPSASSRVATAPDTRARSASARAVCSQCSKRAASYSSGPTSST